MFAVPAGLPVCPPQGRARTRKDKRRKAGLEPRKTNTHTHTHTGVSHKACVRASMRLQTAAGR
eukprot:1995855-Alexandrium_andersonii.AAC.1